MVGYPVFNCLYRNGNWGTGMDIDESKPGITGELAESIDVIEPNRSWVFHLRKDVKWHDGEKFSADDVVWSYYVMLHKDVAASMWSSNNMIKGAKALHESGGEALAGVTKVDDYTVKIELEKPSPAFVSSPQPIMPKHAFKDVPLDKLATFEPYSTKPIGTGPFKVSNVVAGQYAELARNDDFFVAKPHLDKFIVRWLAADAIDAALEAGEVDGAWCSGTAAFTRLSSLPQLIGVPQATKMPVGIQFNAKRFQNVSKLHEAVLYAVDREKINKELEGGLNVITDYVFRFVTFGGMGTAPAGLRAYAYDPAKAKDKLKEAGYDSTKKAGWMVWADPTPTQLAIQAMLNDAGFNVEFRIIDSSAINKIWIEDEDYDLVWTNVPATDDLETHWLYWKCGARQATGAGFNCSSFCDETLDAAWKAAVDEADPKKQEELAKKVALMWQDRMPMAMFWSGAVRDIYNRRVQGCYFRNNYLRAVRTPYERLWIKKA